MPKQEYNIYKDATAKIRITFLKIKKKCTIVRFVTDSDKFAHIQPKTFASSVSRKMSKGLK